MQENDAPTLAEISVFGGGWESLLKYWNSAFWLFTMNLVLGSWPPTAMRTLRSGFLPLSIIDLICPIIISRTSWENVKYRWDTYIVPRFLKNIKVISNIFTGKYLIAKYDSIVYWATLAWNSANQPANFSILISVFVSILSAASTGSWGKDYR